MRKIITLYLLSQASASHALTAENNALGHGELLRMVAGLCLVLLIIFCLSWILKRLNARHLTQGKGFKSIAAMTLGPRERLLLVQAGDRFLLIGAAAGSINLLCDFGEQLPEGFDNETRASFSSLLKSASGKS